MKITRIDISYSGDSAWIQFYDDASVLIEEVDVNGDPLTVIDAIKGNITCLTLEHLAKNAPFNTAQHLVDAAFGTAVKPEEQPELLACAREYLDKHQPKTQTYTVVGLFPNGEGRFADSYEAASPEAAESMALAEHPELQVAGVFPGAVMAVA